jgi:MFS family permease
VTRHHATLATLAFALVGFSIGQTSFIPAVGDLARKLDVSTAAATWAVTASFLSAAVLTPVLGRLADIFGRRRVLVFVLAAVCAGSLVSALAWDLPSIVAGRVLYGAGSGLFPVGFAIVREAVPADRRGQAIGVLGALGGIGGGLGPAIGGGLVQLGSYSTIFWAGAVIGLVPAILTPFVIEARRHPALDAVVDWRGALLLAAGLAMPLLGITNSVKWGWLDSRSIGLEACGLLVLAFFVWFERHTAAPLLDMGIALQSRVALANGGTLLLGVANYAPCILVPLLGQAAVGRDFGLGLGPAESGLLLAPGCGAMVVTGAVSGRLRERIAPRTVFAVGALVTAVGLVALAASLRSMGGVSLGATIAFAGVGLAVGSMANLVVDAVPSSQTGEATGVNTVSRIVGAAIGTQVAVAIVSSTETAGRPAERGFVIAFAVSAAIAVVAAVIGLRIRDRDVDKNYADD